MRVKYGNLLVDVEIIGGFKLNNKEYAVCSYADSIENYKIVIVEVLRNGNNIEVIDIQKDEKELVLEKYKEIEKQILGGDYVG